MFSSDKSRRRSVSSSSSSSSDNNHNNTKSDPGFSHAPPPPYAANQSLPPSGFRIALTTEAPFPPIQQTFRAPFSDLDGSPVFFGSAFFGRSIQPCKIAPRLPPSCRVPYGGSEVAHHGRFDLLPFTPETMELVPASNGRLPPGRRLVEGGYEENGSKLYHAVATIQGVRVPGKTGEHLVSEKCPIF